MIIYGGSKETVEKQLKCNHNFEGPFIDMKFRWRTCSKCFVCDFDVRSEQDYYKKLKQNIEDEEMEEPELSEEEQDEKYSGRICAEPGCYNYPMNGVIYCIKHIHGSDRKASEEAIAWKKKKENNYTCPKSKRIGLPSMHGNFCTTCGNKERGLI